MALFNSTILLTKKDLCVHLSLRERGRLGCAWYQECFLDDRRHECFLTPRRKVAGGQRVIGQFGEVSRCNQVDDLIQNRRRHRIGSWRLRLVGYMPNSVNDVIDKNRWEGRDRNAGLSAAECRRCDITRPWSHYQPPLQEEITRETTVLDCYVAMATGGSMTNSQFTAELMCWVSAV